MKMDEIFKDDDIGYGIYKMLNIVKAKIPDEYRHYIYNGMYIGLKSDYIRYLVEPTKTNRMQFFMIFVKDSIMRSPNYTGSKYVKSNKNVWFYLCSGFHKFELLDLNSKIRRELFKYMSEYNISVLNYYNEKMFREETIFYFDDTHELHGNNKYEKYIEAFKNKYINNA